MAPMTCSLAVRRRLPRAPLYPLARSRMTRRPFLACTDRLTRAMVLLPQHLLDARLVDRRDRLGPLQAAQTAARLVAGHEVRTVRLTTPDLARAGEFEALCGGSPRLLLRHDLLLFSGGVRLHPGGGGLPLPLLRRKRHRHVAPLQLRS